MIEPETEDQGVCELCHESILMDQPHVRILADAAIWNGESRFQSLTENKVLVFSVFHSSCLQETMNDEGLEVPYIWEARSLCHAALRGTAHGPLSGSDRKPAPRGHLRLLQGGIR